MRLYSLSASKIKTFKQCEFKFYIESHLGLSTGTSFAAEQGSLVHAVFEKHAKSYQEGDNNPKIAKEWRDKIFNAYREKGIWKISKKMLEVERQCSSCPFFSSGHCEIANKSIDEFEGCPKEDYEETIWLIEKVLNDRSVNNPLNKKIIDVENKFSLEIPDGNDTIKVRGYMDVVTELDKDTCEVFDYKTGKFTQSYNVCLKDPQLLIYHLAARKEYSYENILITIYYLRKKPVTLCFSKKDEKGTEKALKHYWNTISACESPQRRCDKRDGSVKYDYVCEKMCDKELCEKEYKKFQDNGMVILPPPKKLNYDRVDWADVLDEL